MLLQIIYVAVGGFFGSILRFFLSNLFAKHYLGTWLANVSGAILLAYLLELHYTTSLSDLTFYMLTIGFCGAYTTFSTFGKEVIAFIVEKKWCHALLYVATSFILPFIAVSMILSK